MSQDAVAAGCNCDHSYISRLEQGKRTTPSRAFLASLVTSLELDEDEAAHLYVAAGYLPPGKWALLSGGIGTAPREVLVRQ
jgi:transcriptional regulator with XRE-family HTH domain